MQKDEDQSDIINRLEITTFKERFPWIGGDLQTLRDTFVSEKLPIETGEKIKIPIPEMPCGHFGKGHLISFLDRPIKSSSIKGLVLILHGLGGSSRRQGLRRMSLALIESGFAVLRLNLRGADPGRELAGGTYSAKCNSDLIPAIVQARKICELLSNQKANIKNKIPLFGVGISLGGTMLLNACLEAKEFLSSEKKLLDGLVCISSPFDLSACSASIERPRNRIYQRWLLQRLVRQTLADPFGIRKEEKEFFSKNNHGKLKIFSSIREFDSAITAPRWGYKDVDDYYKKASPINNFFIDIDLIPKSIFIQSLDDPWVPYQSLDFLRKKYKESYRDKRLEFVLTTKGGHNGFHGLNGCWGDKIVVRWLLNIFFASN